MGWKKLETSLFYLQSLDFGNEEYHSATAKTVSEAPKLIEQSFEYVTEFDGVKLFRKRSNLQNASFFSKSCPELMASLVPICLRQTMKAL